MNEKIAVVLLSGGLDSATVLALAVAEGYRLHAMSFAYGQKHRIEINSARKIAEYYKIKDHIVVSIPGFLFSGSALSAESGEDVPKNREIIPEIDIPATYVPARNILFLSYALAYAEKIGAEAIFIGVNAVDYSGYPDCRPEFIEAFQKAANIGTKAGIERGVRILTPLISMKKSEIITLGTKLGVDYSLTHSCYDPDDNGASCGACDSCLIRRRGFIEAGVPDPTVYRNAR